MLFAANFIRWATHRLVQQSLPAKNAIDVRKLGTKRQVNVTAHVSAQVIQNYEGKLLKFRIVPPSTIGNQSGCQPG